MIYCMKALLAPNIPEIPICITKMCPCNIIDRRDFEIEKQIARHFVNLIQIMSIKPILPFMELK